MTWPRLLEWAAFQLVWLVCALSAASQRTAPAVAAAAIFIIVVLTRTGWQRPEWVAVIASGIAGLLVESLFAWTGLIRYAAAWPSSELAPAWLLALWFAFGATAGTLAGLLGPPYLLKAAAAGFVAGPFAYWAGERLGALEVSYYGPMTYLAVAIAWAVALPALLYIREMARYRSHADPAARAAGRTGSIR